MQDSKALEVCDVNAKSICDCLLVPDHLECEFPEVEFPLAPA